MVMEASQNQQIIQRNITVHNHDKVEKIDLIFLKQTFICSSIGWMFSLIILIFEYVYYTFDLTRSKLFTMKKSKNVLKSN